MKKLLLALSLVASPAFGQAVVCPPHLSYCYEKPILKEKRASDQHLDIIREMQQDYARIQARKRSSEAELRYELDRSWWLSR